MTRIDKSLSTINAIVRLLAFHAVRLPLYAARLIWTGATR